ncbi:hypothetical protein V6N12_003161 [Hibiscus sabdariffa]|uniref:Solute-binding protein family 3/N-terminal domain-containing protein n=1 Tax=Hibiscus sabdariffa TaxID=183260 RepID=A0ABR2ECU4_9ROSI
MLKTYDVAIGDMVTTRSRDQHVELSPSYLEPGFMMVVKTKTKDLNKFWWFLSPFTPQMWLIIAALNVLIGVIIWVIESQYEDGPNFVEAPFLLQNYKEALDSGSIKAAFLLTPYAKILFAKYCHDFIEINPTYGNNPEGYRFVFPKGSLLANGIAYAILKLERNGELQHMEDQISASFKCSRKPVEDATIQNVGVGSFMGVFVLFGGVSITALLITLIHLLYRHLVGRT